MKFVVIVKNQFSILKILLFFIRCKKTNFNKRHMIQASPPLYLYALLNEV